MTLGVDPDDIYHNSNWYSRGGAGPLSPANLVLSPSGDSTGISDSASLIRLQAALPAGGAIIFDIGNYYLQNIPLKNNISYKGQGSASTGTPTESTTILNLPSGSASMFIMPTSQTTLRGVGFKNIELNGGITDDVTTRPITAGNYMQVSSISVAAGVATATLSSARPASVVVGTKVAIMGTEDCLLDSVYTITATGASTISWVLNTAHWNGITIGVNAKFNVTTGVTGYKLGIIAAPIFATTTGGFAACGGTLINLRGVPTAITTIDDFQLDGVTLRDAAFGIDSDRGNSNLAYSGYWVRNTYFNNCLVGQVVNEQPNHVDVYYSNCHVGLLGRLNDANIKGGIFTYCNYGTMPDIENSLGITFSHFNGTQWFYNYICAGLFQSYNKFTDPMIACASPSTDAMEFGFLIMGDHNTLNAPTAGDSPWGSQSPIKFTGYGSSGFSLTANKILGGTFLSTKSYSASAVTWNSSKLPSGVSMFQIDNNTYDNTISPNTGFVIMDTNAVALSSVDKNTIIYRQASGSVLDAGAGHFAISLGASSDASVSGNKFQIVSSTANAAVCLINTSGNSTKVDNNEVNASDAVQYLAYCGGTWKPGQSYSNNNSPNSTRTYNKASTKARGVATIGASGTSVTVTCNAAALGGFLFIPPFYLGGGASVMVPTAQSIKVMPTANMTPATDYWVDTVSMSNTGDLSTLSFKINTGAAVTGATTFAWEVDIGSGATL